MVWTVCLRPEGLFPSLHPEGVPGVRGSVERGCVT